MLPAITGAIPEALEIADDDEAHVSRVSFFSECPSTLRLVIDHSFSLPPSWEEVMTAVTLRCIFLVIGLVSGDTYCSNTCTHSHTTNTYARTHTHKMSRLFASTTIPHELYNKRTTPNIFFFVPTWWLWRDAWRAVRPHQATLDSQGPTTTVNSPRCSPSSTC